MAILGYQALSEGFKAGVEMANLPDQERERTRQEQIQTQTLSEQATQMKQKNLEMQDEYSTKMATRAAFAKAQTDDINLDTSTLIGKQQQYQAAAKNAQADGRPDIAANFMSKSRELEEQGLKNQEQIGKIKVAQAKDNSFVMSQAMLNPQESIQTLAEYADKTGNAVIRNTALVFADQAPVPVQFTRGVPKKFSDLAASEKEAYFSGIRSAFPGNEVEKSAHNVIAEEQARNDLQRKKERDAQEKRHKEQEIARKQQANSLEAEGIILRHDTAMAKITAEISKYPAKIEDPKSIKLPFRSKIMIGNPDPRYQELLKLRAEIQKSRNAIGKTPKEEPTSQNAQALAWAKANPKDPRAIAIKLKLGEQ